MPYFTFTFRHVCTVAGIGTIAIARTTILAFLLLFLLLLLLFLPVFLREFLVDLVPPFFQRDWIQSTDYVTSWILKDTRFTFFFFFLSALPRLFDSLVQKLKLRGNFPVISRFKECWINYKCSTRAAAQTIYESSNLLSNRSEQRNISMRQRNEERAIRFIDNKSTYVWSISSGKSRIYFGISWPTRKLLTSFVKELQLCLKRLYVPGLKFNSQ